MSNIKHLTNGIWKENPTVVLVLGTCPTLAVTTQAFNGLGMGAATTFVLIFSNLFISLLKNYIPDKVRIAAFIVIIASFVTVVDLVMKAYVPDLYATLGIFIPLIVVNCIILGRAEAFAQKNKPFASLLDGLGMGIGFTLALTLMGSFRELLGNGSIFNIKLVSEQAQTILLFILPPGAFFTYGYMIAIVNRIKSKQKSN
ncbi:MAG TPA: electron transport complex subunit E [Prolixibacteraceae bacterium]|nr:electron transport complex subunit E [Bacteroidales bacterium]HQN94394.1 electron transport complex subunit E [Prolixibacteraceae bacterium]